MLLIENKRYIEKAIKKVKKHINELNLKTNSEIEDLINIQFIYHNMATSNYFDWETIQCIMNYDIYTYKNYSKDLVKETYVKLLKNKDYKGLNACCIDSIITDFILY